MTKLGEDSVLSSIQRMIDEAQHNKPAIAKLADRIASWFVSILLTVAAFIATIRATNVARKSWAMRASMTTSRAARAAVGS